MQKLSLLLLVALSCAAPKVQPDGFVSLCNGRNLNGWVNANCAPETWSVRDGVIHCTGLPTGALRTARQYENFILELEFKVDPKLNSGVQFRSEFYKEETEKEIAGKKKKFPADRVFGYQYEIDPSARAWTGGVYDEARTGWLADLSMLSLEVRLERDGFTLAEIVTP